MPRRLRAFLLAALALPTAIAAACPFCSTESRTLTEELADCDFAIVAKLVQPAAAQELGLNDKPQDGVPFGTVDPETGEATFRVESLLIENDDLIGPATGETIKAVFFGEPDFEASYLIRGLGDPLEWAIPIKLSPTAVAYVKQLQALPTEGADRLAFFQPYFEHEDKLLAQDAYDEFARAPYADVKGLRDRMDREQLLAWIESNGVSPNRRRLYLTMLGVCGQPEDVPRIERLLLSDTRALAPAAEAAAALSVVVGGPLSVALTPETVRLDGRKQKLGLDAMVACYLALRGGEGLDVIDKRFLMDESVDYSQVYSTLMAIRFLGEESDLVSRERLLQSARLLLNNRDFADQVIPDLARWEDWSVLDQLVTMFKGTVAPEGETPQFERYVRDPIVTYLDIAAEQGGELAERANAGLAELEPIDPDSFRRARSLWKFGALARALPGSEPTDDKTDDAVSAEALEDSPEITVTTTAEEPVDAPPNPSGFGGETEEKTDSDLPPSPATFAASQESAPQPEETVGAAEQPSEPAVAKPEEPATVATTVDPIGGTAAELPAAPQTWLLVGAPLVAFVGFFGLFWTVLHNGV